MYRSCFLFVFIIHFSLPRAGFFTLVHVRIQSINQKLLFCSITCTRLFLPYINNAEYRELLPYELDLLIRLVAPSQGGKLSKRLVSWEHSLQGQKL